MTGLRPYHLLYLLKYGEQIVSALPNISRSAQTYAQWERTGVLYE